jgi:hypothetical protein
LQLHFLKHSLCTAAEFTPNYYILEINRAIACAALGNDRDAT